MTNSPEEIPPGAQNAQPPNAAGTPPQPPAGPYAPQQWPYGASPPQNPRRPLVVAGIIGAILLLAAVATGIIIMLNSDDSDKKTSHNKETTAPITPLQDEYKNKTVAWRLPIGVQGWTNDISEQNGVNRFIHSDSDCQITYRQAFGANSQRAAGKTPYTSVQTSLDAVEERVTNFSEKTTTAFLFKTSSGKSVIFTTKQVAYRGTDGVNYTLKVGAQWFGDVELLVMVACPSNKWVSEQGTVSTFLNRGGISVH